MLFKKLGFLCEIIPLAAATTIFLVTILSAALSYLMYSKTCCPNPAINNGLTSTRSGNEVMYGVGVASNSKLRVVNTLKNFNGSLRKRKPSSAENQSTVDLLNLFPFSHAHVAILT